MNFASARFETLRRRAKTGILIEGAAWLALATVAFVVVSYAVDRSLRLEVGYRAVLLGSFLAAIAAVVARRIARPMRVELGDDELALAVERQSPELRQALISAVQFERSLVTARSLPESEELMQRVVRDVEGCVAALPFGRAVDARRFARFSSSLALCCIAIAAWFATHPMEARLWALRNLVLANTPWPHDTELAFLDVDPSQPLRVAERDDVTLRVKANGVVPDRVVVTCEFAGGEVVERAMELVGADVFTLTLATVLENATVRAEGGDGETGELRIALVPRPKISDLELVVHHPAYLGLEPQTLRDLGADVAIPQGAEVEVRAKSDKPLMQAELVVGDSEHLPAAVASDGLAIAARFTPKASGSVTLDALDRDRLAPSQVPQAYVHLVADEAPKVEFKTSGVGSLITAEARIPGRLVVRDDHRIDHVDATYQLALAVTGDDATVSGDPPPFEPAPVTGLEAFAAGGAEFSTEVVFDLRSLDGATDPIPENRRVQPEHIVALRFTARDNCAPQPQEGASETMHFRVVTREKLLEDLRRRQGEQYEDLVRARDRERALRTELADAVLPAQGSPATDRGKVAILDIAREQQALGRRVASIADRYEAILDEFFNNRLFEQNVTRSKHARIVSPLRTLAAEDFPSTSSAGAALAESGGEEARQALLPRYDQILVAIERVLAEMEHAEDIAAVIEALRIVIKTEEQAKELVEERRRRAVDELFGPKQEGPK